MSACAVLYAALVTLALALAPAVADEDGDSAAFAVAVVRGGAVRCSGALVSLRAVLTAARCALGPELWARPATGTTAVRVLRVAVADPLASDSPPDDEADQWAWSGASGELALLELEEALPAARPILAAPAGGCAPRAECYVPRLRSHRLRIVEAQLEPVMQCVARGARWPTPLRERALCLLGPRLCESDCGAGVVCGGKLCGVVAWSAQSEAAPSTEDSAAPGPGRCGDTHAAASVPHARRFLHCALVHGACGRGECERLCSERWLGAEEAWRKQGGGAPVSDVTAPTPSPVEPSRTEPSSDTTTEAGGASHAGEDGEQRAPQRIPQDAGEESERRAVQKVAPHASEEGERRAEPIVAPQAGEAGERRATQKVAPQAGGDGVRRASLKVALHAGENGERRATQSGAPADSRDRNGGAQASTPNALEFEPNRPDFKAGEYGDNAADYGAEYGGTTSPLPPTRTDAALTSATRQPADVEAQLAHDTTPRAPPPAAPAHAPTSAAHTHTLLLLFYHLPFYLSLT